jgi:hypothetical protein
MGLRGLKAFTGLQGKRSRSEIGLGLLEVLISLALIMILVLPVISLVVNVGETSVRMDYRDTAANLVSKVLACARSQPTSLLGEVNMCAPGVANPPPLLRRFRSNKNSGLRGPRHPLNTRESW